MPQRAALVVPADSGPVSDDALPSGELKFATGQPLVERLVERQDGTLRVAPRARTENAVKILQTTPAATTAHQKLKLEMPVDQAPAVTVPPPAVKLVIKRPVAQRIASSKPMEHVNDAPVSNSPPPSASTDVVSDDEKPAAAAVDSPQRPRENSVADDKPSVKADSQTAQPSPKYRTPKRTEPKPESALVVTVAPPKPVEEKPRAETKPSKVALLETEVAKPQAAPNAVAKPRVVEREMASRVVTRRKLPTAELAAPVPPAREPVVVQRKDDAKLAESDTQTASKSRTTRLNDTPATVGRAGTATKEKKDLAVADAKQHNAKPDAKKSATVPREIARHEAARPEVASERRIRTVPVATHKTVVVDAAPIEIAAAKPSDLQPLHTPLPWAQVSRNAPEMITANGLADQRVRHGFQLAERGALYSARAEFITALKAIAEANDVQQSTRMYTKAAAAGLTALKESNDFIRQTTGNGEADVARIVARHKTPVLRKLDTTDMPPTLAAHRYYAYAQEQLAAAAAQEMVGSMALFGLAKVAVVGITSKSQQLEYTGQAMALYRAALIAEPRNYLAANELGVLLASNSQPAQAKELFARSVSLSPQAATWQNLAVVHHRLGEWKQWEEARSRSLALQSAKPDPKAPAVEWVDPATFARMAPATDGLVPPAVPTRTESSVKPAATSAKPAANVARKGLSDVLPWSGRR